MPRQTNNYKLEYFFGGSYYSAASDYRRFWTLDYNLESYVGVVGVGILKGWTIEKVSGLTVQILPGEGIIDGYYAESPYSVKQRSSMVSGEREIEVIEEDDIPESNLADTDTIYNHHHFIKTLDGSNNGLLGNSIGAGTSHNHTITSGVVGPASAGTAHTHTLLSQRRDYIKVIQLYDASYNPDGEIENAYVKVVVPYQMTAYDNTDTYIFVEFPSGMVPYPPLNQPPRPPLPGPPPDRNSYSDYESYRLAYIVWENKVTTINNYKWYVDSVNHFTAVEFVKSGGFVVTNSRVLLGRIKARSGEVVDINTNGVNSIHNMESVISKFAKEYIVGHKHGGKSAFDPPKVRLETDIRSAVLSKYVSEGKTVFDVVESGYTSIELGHKHTYVIDSSGDGNTIEQIGDQIVHYHNINEGTVGDATGNYGNVASHIHTVTFPSDASDMWDEDSNYVIYVNDVAYADQTSTKATVDSVNKNITFNSGVNVAYNKYSISVPISLEYPFAAYDPVTHNKVSVLSETYSYEGKAYSVYNFMLEAINDFNKKYENFFRVIEYDYYTGEEVEGGGSNPYAPDEGWSKRYDPKSLAEKKTYSNVGVIERNLQDNDPFSIYENGQKISGLTPLQNQSTAAQALLEKVSDSFVFTPPAAKNVRIVLLEMGESDSVEIEIMDNTEVQGVLKPENIIWLNANKILTGEFEPEIIPFISHAGRLNESCLPLQYAMISDDGVRYSVVPSITDSVMGHYHKLDVDESTSGVTTEVMIGEESVYYQSNVSSSDTYFVYHSHGSDSGVVKEVGSDGLLQWQNNVEGANLTSSVHTHAIVYPVVGDNKTVYSIKEDSVGNIYAGTSDGLRVVASEPMYEFVLNGVELFYYGSDLWSILEKAKLQYEKEVGSPFVVTEDLYGEAIEDAYDDLTAIGDSVWITGTPYPDRPTCTIMIKKVSDFKMPNYKYEKEVLPYEVGYDETVMSSRTEDVNGEEVQYDTVERDFNNSPVWSMELASNFVPGENYIASYSSVDLVTVASDTMATAYNLNQDIYQNWSLIQAPFFIGIARKVIKDKDGNYWFSTNNGIGVFRSYYGSNVLTFTNLPSGNPDIKDIIEGEPGYIYCVSEYGAFKTINDGKTWSKIYDVIGGFEQICRDRTLDKTNTVSGHYHLYETNIDGTGFTGESIGTGTNHVHEVTSWSVSETLGHTHTIITTLYLVDSFKVVYRSIDSGVTWSEFVDLPDGECGDIFASFGYIYVSGPDGLYRSNGGSWALVFAHRVYSYNWNYDVSGFFVGGDNFIYKTLDGNSFDLVHSFSGLPSSILVENGNKKYFGYAYNNDTQVFHFKEIIMESDNVELTALLDSNKWYAVEGGWDISEGYDIYINNKLTYSTKSDKDNRETYGYNFAVDTDNGMIDFSASTVLTSPVNEYDGSINVSDSTKFLSGDRITVYSKDNRFYSVVSYVDSNNLVLDSRVTKSMSLPVVVEKINSLNASSNVTANIYNSLLSNIGVLTHENVEDGLSLYSDGRPYKFNDTFLSNLIQLTQGVRYAYPTINSKFINSLFYDFRYSWDPLSTDYIGNYVDLLTSDIYNQKFYDSNFDTKFAKSINKVLIGYGSFANTIIVATDIGVFWSRFEASFEANWFYINELPYAVYDLMIYGQTRVLAATDEGLYWTEDMTTWTLDDSPAANYPCYSLALRWGDENNYVQIPSHGATFESLLGSNFGTITAATGTPYSTLKINSWIKVNGAGNKNGSYSIQDIQDAGAGVGSKLLVTPSFNGPNGYRDNTIITMGVWWDRWNGDVNAGDVNITSTLLLGCKDHVSLNDGGQDWVWNEAITSIDGSFNVRQFLSLSSGRVLLTSIGQAQSDQKNYLMKSDDLGQEWDSFKEFGEVRGTISSSEVSDFNNTVLKVVYTYPLSYVYLDGALDQLDINVYSAGSDVTVFSGKIVWNEKSDSDEIIVFGNSLNSLILSGGSYSFIVSPPRVNTMAEGSNETVFFGTNRGLFYDSGTTTSTYYPSGSIATAGYNGTVEKIDISGTIKSVWYNANTGNTTLMVTADTNLRGGYLVGNKIYVTDTSGPESYDIISNGSITPGLESEIVIGPIELDSSYVGKNFRVPGKLSSKIYVDFELPVFDNQFDNGTIYVIDNKYGNYGKSYAITKSTTEYIEVSPPIIPTSTLILNSISTNSSPEISGTDVQNGQKIRLIDSTKLFPVWGSLDREFKENALVGLTLSAQGKSYDIYSNFSNNIVLSTTDYTSLSTGNTFDIEGTLFEPVPSFSNTQTSVESGHYHYLDLIDGTVSGEVGSFGTVNSSYVTINVTNTTNFNIPIVQLRSDLFYGGGIIFTNKYSPNLRYDSEVVEHSATTIKVNLKNSSYWNFSASDLRKISVGWKWEIDGTNYGYTDGTYYDDFEIDGYGLTQTISRGDTLVYIEDTSALVVGDKVKLQDDTLSYEINYVSQIVSTTSIRLSTAASRTFEKSNSSQIKVLRDSFTNTHIHQVRDNELEPISVQEYLIRGYPSQHSHRVLPSMTDISTLINQNNSVYCVGSGSIIYKSSDVGSTWSQYVDLNDYVESNEEIEGSSTATLYSGKLVVGANNGSIFAQVDEKGGIIRLRKPI